jgi:UDP-N-acetylglucosamine--N-acetylmuramyl-(pentapeptide) pyrophosphoryl-undecaprenol N-acetylglucosamine transferase
MVADGGTAPDAVPPYRKPYSPHQTRTSGNHLTAALAGRYLVTGFVGPELPDVLALADVIISRSGAGTIAELTALGKASVLIPLPTSAEDEQRHNARHLAALGAALALDGEVTPAALTSALGPLPADPARHATCSLARESMRRTLAVDAAQGLLDAGNGAFPARGVKNRRQGGTLRAPPWSL